MSSDFSPQNDFFWFWTLAKSKFGKNEIGWKAKVWAWTSWFVFICVFWWTNHRKIYEEVLLTPRFEFFGESSLTVHLFFVQVPDKNFQRQKIFFSDPPLLWGVPDNFDPFKKCRKRKYQTLWKKTRLHREYYFSAPFSCVFVKTKSVSFRRIGIKFFFEMWQPLFCGNQRKRVGKKREGGSQKNNRAERTGIYKIQKKK